MEGDKPSQFDASPCPSTKWELKGVVEVYVPMKMACSDLAVYWLLLSLYTPIVEHFTWSSKSDE